MSSRQRLHRDRLDLRVVRLEQALERIDRFLTDRGERLDVRDLKILVVGLAAKSGVERRNRSGIFYLIECPGSELTHFRITIAQQRDESGRRLLEVCVAKRPGGAFAHLHAGI